MSARFRRRGEIIEAVRFDGTNAEECARCAGDESGNHLEFEFRVGWWYLRMDTRATVLTDKTFSLLFEPVPLPEPAPADGWQPIETAPKDGRPVLGFMPSYYRMQGGQSLIIWVEHVAEAGWYDGGAFKTDPTHWQPLPAPPVVEGKP